MARKKQATANSGETSENECPNLLRIGLLGVIAALAVTKLMLALLWGLQMTCGTRPLVEPVQADPLRFWKRSASTEAETVTSPSLICRTTWALLERVPFPTPTVESTYNVVDDECLEPAETKPNLLKKIASRLPKRNRSSANSAKQRQQAELKSSFTNDVVLTKRQAAIQKELGGRFHASDQELATVSWGGPGGPRWCTPDLLNSYLRIMKWPEDLISNFPFKLCTKGCPAEFALQHTLEWRQKYKPWLISPAAIQENTNGFVYTRGHGKSPSGDNAGHALVWIRAGVKTDGIKDPESYFRAILNTLEMAVANCLHRSHEKVGKFNVIIDAAHVSYSMLPKLGSAKKGIVMLQDHNPDRLGMVLLANLSKVSEILLNMIKPLITKEVRDKIVILPSNPKRRHAMLESVMDQDYIPDFLGGTDTYRFSSKHYYRQRRLHCTNAEAKEYLSTMPYHA